MRSSIVLTALAGAAVASGHRTLIGRDGTCAKQPAGSGPVANPDNVDGFFALTALQTASVNAPSPDGYATVFTGIQASLNANNYMGLWTLTSYDTLGCASLCDRTTGCVAFNMYSERDPTLEPNAFNCSNPSSTTNYKCTLWGSPVSTSQAKNSGQWRDSFQVVVTGSNAYNKAAGPGALPGYDGPTQLGGAINAPLDSQRHDTYMGVKIFPFDGTTAYDPSVCSKACIDQTTYNSAHPARDGSFRTCRFFNSYVQSSNGVPTELHCSLYNQTWGAQYATNYEQYQGANRITISRSYSYTLSAVAVAYIPDSCFGEFEKTANFARRSVLLELQLRFFVLFLVFISHLILVRTTKCVTSPCGLNLYIMPRTYLAWTDPHFVTSGLVCPDTCPLPSPAVRPRCVSLSTTPES